MNLLRRGLRYLYTWVWLLQIVLRNKPSLFFATIGFGIAARLGTLVGFIVIIKSAIWILNPKSISEVLYSVVELSETSLFILLVAAPGLVFLMKGLAQALHGSYSLKLRTSIANIISLDAAKKNLQSNEAIYYENKKNAELEASKLQTYYAKAFVIQTLLYNTIILSFVFVLSLFVGIFLDWMIVSILMSFLILLAIFFINYKHKKSFELTAKLVETKKEESTSIKGFVADCMDEGKSDETNSKLGGLQKILKSTDRKQFLSQRFESDSLLFMDVGQALMIVTFLFLLIGQDGDANRLTQLALLAVIFRFLINYMQAIVQSVIKLSPHYSFVLNLKKELTT